MWSVRRVLFAVVTDEEWSRAEGLPAGTMGRLLAVLTAGGGGWDAVVGSCSSPR